MVAFAINASNNRIIIASTTSTYDSGLLTYLNNIFESEHNIEVQVLSLGTGQALRAGQDGNVEILLVHHTPSEINFVKNNYGTIRYKLMYNDYVLIGPKNDYKTCVNISNKLNYIKSNFLTFISRGDDSGTHEKEKELWKLLDLETKNFGSWYFEIGQGMGSAILMANEKFGYAISDRSTWVTHNKKNNLKIICENFKSLFNQYGLILISKSINEKLNINMAKIYINWLISDEGKRLINSYKKNGSQLFFYNHH